MNRRGFLSLLGLGVAGIALEQAIPLGRVWSFPSKIIVPTLPPFYKITYVTRGYLEALKYNLCVPECLQVTESGLFRVGDAIAITNSVSAPSAVSAPAARTAREIRSRSS